MLVAVGVRVEADYMDEVAGLRDRPYMLRSLMVATATLQETGNAGGADSLGLGGLNFLNGASAYTWFFHFWDGSNSYYNSTSNPNHTSQGNILTYSISQGDQVHAAIAWNIRAGYTFANKLNTYPIGQDYNLFVCDPDGILVDGSASSRNPYERVEFTAQKTGSYKFRIVRAANRDTAGRYELGFTILMQ